MLKFTGAVAAPTPVIVPGAQFVDIPLSNMRKVNDIVKLGCKPVSVCALAIRVKFIAVLYSCVKQNLPSLFGYKTGFSPL